MEKILQMRNGISKYIESKEIILYTLGLIILLIIPYSGINSYIIRVMIMIGIYAILALGLNIITGYTGLLSLGNAGFYAIGAYTSALLATRFGFPFITAMLSGAAMAGFSGLLLGLPTLRLSGTYLAIATLGFGEIVRMVLLNWDSVTNGPMGILKIPRPVLFGVELGIKNGGLYYLILFLLLLVIAFCYLIIHSKIGRAFVSIREDELAATLMGINTTRYKVLAFVLSAFISGISGSFYAHMVRYIDPNTFVFDTSIMIISIVILGGMGTLRGMILGAAILIAFPEFLRFFAEYRFIVYGLVLVFMMRYRSQGILGGQSKRKYKLPVRLMNYEGREQ